MRNLTKLGIFAVLALAVVVIPAAAVPAPVASMGVVLQADHANLNGSPALDRATIFSGDTLSTDNAGGVRAQFGSSQIYLYSNSNVAVSHTANGFSADLKGGSVLLSSAAGETFMVLADGAVVQPKANQKSVAQISWVSPTELMLTSRQGDLQVTMGDETRTVNEGASYRMMIAPASQPGSKPAAQAGGTGATAFTLVAVGVVGAGTGVALWRAFESTSSN